MTAGHVHTLNFENLHQKVGCTNVLSIFVLHAIVEGTWVKCTIFITTMCVEMKNNQGQPCIKVVEIVIFIIIQIVHRV